MREDDIFVDPDMRADFADNELAGTWERTGKGKARWKPGDSTGDAVVDYNLLWSSWKLTPLLLHVYDSCPECTKARIVLGRLGMPFQCVFYGFGEGADPALCGGTGYSPAEGPVPLVGQKSLPVLSGSGVPCLEGMNGLLGATEICSFGSGVAKGGRLALATEREDIAAWLERATAVITPLVRARLPSLAIADFADARDVEHAAWLFAEQGFDSASAEAETPRLLAELSTLLEDLAAMLRGSDERDGSPRLNTWAWGMDDAIVLSILRNLTCIKGVTWPPEVLYYLEASCSKASVDLFTEIGS